MPSTTAIYVDENLKFRVYSGDVDIPTPGPDELPIEPEYSGTNPADVKHPTLLGIYPTRLGYGFCGKVLKAGPDSTFQIRDTVAGYIPTGLGRPAKYGAHQTYTICPKDMAFSVPASLPRHHATCLPVVTMTAADAVYNHMKFPLPHDVQRQSSSRNAKGPLLIWGASSGVGLCAFQFARASGVFPIIVTASPERHPLLLELGATHCLDYKSPTVGSDIMTLFKVYGQKRATYALDAVGSPGCPGNSIMRVQRKWDPRLGGVPKGSALSYGYRHYERGCHCEAGPFPTSGYGKGKTGGPCDCVEGAEVGCGELWTGFRFPSVEVFERSTEDAVNEFDKLSRVGIGLGKIVLKHPFT